MKPLNLDNSPCTPTSSNCVIWSGPSIPCINLCTGDTISDVVYKLALELCAVLDTLKVTNYDISCFNLAACAPNNFQELIQFLITRICELENIDPATVVTVTGSTSAKSASVTDYLMTADPLFGGGTVTIVEYVTLIANKIVMIVTDLSVVNASIANLDTRVNTIEATPAPVFILPSFILSCDIGTIIPVLAAGSTQSIDIVIERFINEEWCPTKAVLGTSTDLTNAVLAQCVAGTDLALAEQYTTPGVVMQVAYPAYIGAPTTISEVIGNLWIALCDLRDRIEFFEKESVVAAGDNVTVSTSVAANVTTYTVNALDSVVVGADDIVVTPSAPVAGVTTYTVSRPKLNFYQEANGLVNVSIDPVPDPSIYHFPVGYNALTYTNTSGVSKTFVVHASYLGTIGLTSLVNTASVQNALDGAIVTTSFAVDTIQYESTGARVLLSGHIFDGATPLDIVDIGSAEQVLTTPGGNPVEYRFVNIDGNRSVAFFKIVTLANGDSVSLKFRTGNTGADAFIAQAQILVTEL
jgi:hypothetical protein